MLFSISLILLFGLFTGWISKKIHLPSLVGMLATGIILGPYVLNLISPQILSISADIRKIALIIILTRAGLSLDTSGLKKIGRPALLMCFLPATFELLGILLLAPKFLGLNLLDAAILGAVLAAVSPAVVVPRMVHLIEEGYGDKKNIPQLILAGASVDDVFVIVLFTTFTGFTQGNGVSVIDFVNIPVSIIFGIMTGFAGGFLISKFFEKIHMRDTSKSLVLLGISFLLVVAEDNLKAKISLTFSSLIAIMFLGVGMQKFRPEIVGRISSKFNKLWICAEILLFVLVGTSVNISYVGKAGIVAIILIFVALLFRMLGVLVCLFGIDFDWNERLFTMLAYTPKATVQAAIGGIPLAMGLSCGDTILTVAVLAILITAPLGAFAIDLTYKKFLENENFL